MIIAQYFVEFIFYSFLGWVWESIYCSINEKKWADRGFLFGPICPIYGSCVVVTSALFGMVGFLSSPDFPIWGIFIICYIGSAIAEFGTSWVLEKRFHARWWDYSNMPLNIQGRICVPVSIAFGLAGVLIVKFLIPAVERFHTMVDPAVYVLLSIILAMLFGADFALTEASLSTILKDVSRMHQEFNEKAQSGYEKVASMPKILEQKVLEGKEFVAEHRDQMAKDYAEKLSLNQKRILLGISKLVPGKAQHSGDEERDNLLRSLKEKVRELRGKRTP